MTSVEDKSEISIQIEIFQRCLENRMLPSGITTSMMISPRQSVYNFKLVRGVHSLKSTFDQNVYLCFLLVQNVSRLKLPYMVLSANDSGVFTKNNFVNKKVSRKTVIAVFIEKTFAFCTSK